MITIDNLVQRITNKLGESVTRQIWTATLVRIIEVKPTSIKVLVKFSTTNFSFDKELKIVESNFDSDTKWNDEIIRQLRRLNDYTNAITQYITQSQSALPSITNNWKGAVTGVTVYNPVNSAVTVLYFRNGFAIEKQYNFSVENFNENISLADIRQQVVHALNAPIAIEYYQNIINQINI